MWSESESYTFLRETSKTDGTELNFCLQFSLVKDIIFLVARALLEEK